MARGYALMFLNKFGREDFLLLESVVTGGGMFDLECSLKETKGIYVVEYDGTPRIRSREWMINRIVEGEDTNFEFWQGGTPSLFCGIRFGASLVEMLWGLDGFTEEEQEEICEVIKDFFVKEAVRGQMKGLVIDKKGYEEDRGWEEFFLRKKKGVFKALVETIAVPRDMFESEGRESGWKVVKEVGGLIVLKR